MILIYRGEEEEEEEEEEDDIYRTISGSDHSQL